MDARLSQAMELWDFWCRRDSLKAKRRGKTIAAPRSEATEGRYHRISENHQQSLRQAMLSIMTLILEDKVSQKSSTSDPSESCEEEGAKATLRGVEALLQLVHLSTRVRVFGALVQIFLTRAPT